MDDFITQELLQVSNISRHPDTKGFDLQAGQSWIYPTNYSVRDYQFNIIQQALFKNTLVSLPTGLGKTFIAAVVMYNYFRWYPQGKIIFMAPTKPLVKQQVNACYDIMAIPKDATAELTGTIHQNTRAEIWKNKRVFFITPHILQNDLGIIDELGSDIKCLVFDEAHRARGNYAYCEVIRRLITKTKLFRVLALSATPGNSVKDVLEVIENLLISNLEFRSEESLDVMPYVFNRSLETIVVPLNEKLEEVRKEYVKILDSYTTFLRRCEILRGDFTNFTKGKIFMTLKNFQRENQNGRYSTPNFNEISKSLNICITLYHAFELLIRHGLRSFLNFFEEHIHKPLLCGNEAIVRIMEDIRDYLGPPINLEPLPDGTYKEISSQTKFGHPKFHKLKDILVGHFLTEENSKVIVFFEFRESVMEAYVLLRKAIPIVRPRIFLGQGSGITQKVQNNVIKAFREGECNTLLSTSIGEEGLDVGDVDLIICFDISNKSPIRMIQRMGRTGRKREGRVIALVTQGKEQQTLKDCIHYKKNLGANVLSAKQIGKGMYANSPRMVPSDIQPKCEKMFITVKKTKPTATKNNNITEMFSKLSSNKFIDDNDDGDVEVIEIKNRLKTPQEFWNLANPLDSNTDSFDLRFSGSLEKQRVLQSTGIVQHSNVSKAFVKLLQFADSKRYNIPITQDGLTSEINDNNNLKQGDIRNMFIKPNPPSEEDLFGSGSAGKISSKPFEKELFLEISNYLAIELSTIQDCKICTESFNCTNYNCDEPEIDLKNIVIPEDAIYQGVTAEDLDLFAQQLTPISKKNLKDMDNDVEQDILCEEYSNDNKNQSDEEEEKLKEMEHDKIQSEFEAPDNFLSLLNKLNVDSPKSVAVEDNRPLDLRVEEILSFFKIASWEALLNSNLIVMSQQTEIYTPELRQIQVEDENHSPDLFEDSPSPIINSSPAKSLDSPILCSAQKLEVIKAKRKIFETTVNNGEQRPNLEKLKFPCNSVLNEISISETLTRIQNDLGDFCNLSSFGLAEESLPKEIGDENLVAGLNTTIDSLFNVSDICDISQLFDTKSKLLKNNLESSPTKSCKNMDNENNKNVIAGKKRFDSDATVSDLDDSPPKINTKQILSKNITDNENVVTTLDQSINSLFNVSDICDISQFLGTKPNEIKNNDKNLSKSNTSKSTTLREHSDKVISNENIKLRDSDSTVSDLGDSPPITQIKKFCLKTSKQNQKLNNDSDSDFELTSSLPVKRFSPTIRKPFKKTQTQMTVTQAINFINEANSTQNKSLQKSKTVQKENNDILLGSLQGFSDLIDIPSFLSSIPSEKQRVIDLTTSDEEFSPSKTATTGKKVHSSQTASTSKISNGAEIEQTSQFNKKLTQNKKITPKFDKSICNLNISANSDDDFEESAIFVKPKISHILSSSDSSCKKKKEINILNRKQKPKRLFSNYIDHEAELSDHGSIVLSEDEGSTDGTYDTSFVDDEDDQTICTQVQANYLKSIKDRSIRGSKFKIPANHEQRLDVFSQDVSNADDTYVDDSFCIATEALEASEEELSELEVLEAKLKEMKKKKRKKHVGDVAKRRRIIVPNDESD